MKVEMIPIADVLVNGRSRKDLGDLDALAESIRERGGLLQPIIVDAERRLIAGHRRLLACKQLGFDEIPAHVARTFDSVVERLLAERDENTCRKDMTASELVALARAIEDGERGKAKQRQVEAGSGNLPNAQVTPSWGPGTLTRRDRTRNMVAAAVGLGSGTTYERAKKVVEAAEANQPGAQQALEEMDRTGRVRPAYEKVRRADTTRPDHRAGPRLHRDAGVEKNLDRLLPTLLGMTSQFDQWQRPESVANEKVAAWDRDLSKAQYAISRLRRRLKGA